MQFNPDPNKQGNEVLENRETALVTLLLSITMTLNNVLIKSI